MAERRPTRGAPRQSPRNAPRPVAASSRPQAGPPEGAPPDDDARRAEPHLDPPPRRAPDLDDAEFTQDDPPAGALLRDEPLDLGEDAPLAPPPRLPPAMESPLLGLEPDPRHYFKAPGLSVVWRRLPQVVAKGSGTMVVVGEPGCGKTLLLRRLLGTLPEGTEMLVLTAPMGEPETFLSALLTALDDQALPNETNPRMLMEAIERWSNQPGRRLLLAIDEAQKLCRENLELLQIIARFKAGPENPVQLLLVGRMELLELLADPFLEPLSETIACSLELPPFTLGETRAYAQSLLKRAGHGPRRLEAPAALLLHIVSRGVPRHINRHLRQALSLLPPGERLLGLNAIRRGIAMDARPGYILGLPPLLVHGTGVLLLLPLAGFLLGSLLGEGPSLAGRHTVQLPLTHTASVTPAAPLAAPPAHPTVSGGAGGQQQPALAIPSRPGADVAPGPAAPTGAPRPAHPAVALQRPAPPPGEARTAPVREESATPPPPAALPRPIGTAATTPATPSAAPAGAPPPATVAAHVTSASAPPPPPPGEEPSRPAPAAPAATPTATAEAPIPPAAVAAPDQNVSGHTQTDQGDYAVQAGSFGNRDNAAAVVERLAKGGYHALIQPVERNGRTLYTVRIPYGDKELAQRAASRIREQEGLPTIVLRTHIP